LSGFDSSRPFVIRTEDLDSDAIHWLSQRCELVYQPFQDEAGLRRLLPRADGLVVRTYTKVDPALLEMAPKLRVVGRAGVGLDNIDIEACRARGVRVVSTPDANSTAVVELVFAVLLDAIRPRVFLDGPLDAARWASVRKELIGRRQLDGMTLGVLGLGRVGSRVARAAAGFGMRVLYHDLREIPVEQRHGAHSATMQQVFADSDAVTIHVDGRASNRGLIGVREFAGMRPDVVFLNASRGMVVDHHALAGFLRSNPGAQAILDVHEPEPIASDNPLLGLSGAHLMPHIGAATVKAHANMSWVVRDVWRVLDGKPAEYPAW